MAESVNVDNFVIADISAGATLTLPDAGERYLSAMIVNENHLLVDPDDEADLAAVAELQKGITLEAHSSTPYTAAEYDTASLDETRSALLTLAKGVGGYRGMFGTADEIIPVRHLMSRSGRASSSSPFSATWHSCAEAAPRSSGSPARWEPPRSGWSSLS